MPSLSKIEPRRMGLAKPTLHLCLVALVMLLNACGGGGGESGPSIVDRINTNSRVAIGKEYSYIRRLPASERLPNGIDTYTSELIRAGLHPETALCARATKLVSGAVVLQYPREAQVISFTVPASEVERALALGYYRLAEYTLFYNLDDPQPCSTD